jgi:lipopolysaccharide/colanic/teichoic acid biosynthesis glycosyltransferase
VIKRILDIIISLPAFIILLPFNAVFAACTFFDVGRPIIFKQTRSGKDGKPFVMVKFRNMNEKKDADGRLLPPSQRVTKFGRFMRKFSLDELLNFWSVLKGDMSIIGPRPQPVFIYERMSERHKIRGAVRPGLECPRMIHVPDEDIYKFQRTFENDIWYVENCSFLTDCKMLIALVKMVFAMGKRGDQAAGKGITYFVGYDGNGRAVSLRNYKELGYEAMMARDDSFKGKIADVDYGAGEEVATTVEQREKERMVTV